VGFRARDLYLKTKHFTRDYVIRGKYYPEIKPLVLLRRLLEKGKEKKRKVRCATNACDQRLKFDWPDSSFMFGGRRVFVPHHVHL